MSFSSPAAGIAAWFDDPVPASLGPDARRERRSEAECRERIAACFPERSLSRPNRTCLEALILLWNDHLDASHSLVQNLGGADAAFVHGIMHRREPDASNARYWFHRVGAHPAFAAIAGSVTPVLTPYPALVRQLLPRRSWDPMAFIEAVDASWGTPAGSEAAILVEVQRREMTELARYLVAH